MTQGRGKCKVEGCKSEKWKTELCIMHYGRKRRTGTYTAYKDISMERRFWSKVKKQKDGCWLWTGAATKDGYGTWEYPKRKRHTVHRLAWKLTMGEIPNGFFLRHKPEVGCISDLCCKPTHMEPSKTNQRVHIYCKNRKHKMTPENTLPKSNGRRCKACVVISRQRNSAAQRRKREIVRLHKKMAA